MSPQYHSASCKGTLFPLARLAALGFGFGGFGGKAAREAGLKQGEPKSQLPTGTSSERWVPLPAVTALGSPARPARCQELLQAHPQQQMNASSRQPGTAGLQKRPRQPGHRTETPHPRRTNSSTSGPKEGASQYLEATAPAPAPSSAEASPETAWRSQGSALGCRERGAKISGCGGELGPAPVAPGQRGSRGRLAHRCAQPSWSSQADTGARTLPLRPTSACCQQLRPTRRGCGQTCCYRPDSSSWQAQRPTLGTRLEPESLTYLAPGSRRRRGPKISPRARGWRLLLSACCDTFPRCRSRNCRVSVFWSGTAGDSRASSSCFRQFSGWGISGERTRRDGSAGTAGTALHAPAASQRGSAVSSRGRVTDPIGTGLVLTPRRYPSGPATRSPARPEKPLPCRTRRMSPCTATGTTGEGRSCR